MWDRLSLNVQWLFWSRSLACIQVALKLLPLLKERKSYKHKDMFTLALWKTNVFNVYNDDVLDVLNSIVETEMDTEI